MYYGYHRVSTKEQHADRGIIGINDFCKKNNINLQKIYVDKISGKNFDRPRYIVLKEDILRKGDTLILYELDRLGRNKEGIKKELLYFKEKGIRLMFLDIPTTTLEYPNIDGSLSYLIMETVNNILIEILAMNSEAEIERKRKRCNEGRKLMKEKGEWDKYGRPRIIKKEEFKKEYDRVVNGELGSLALMRELSLNRDTYFRYVREYKKSKNK